MSAKPKTPQFPLHQQRLAECVAAELRSDLLEVRPRLDQLRNQQGLWDVLTNYPEPFAVHRFEEPDSDAGFRPVGARLEFNLRPVSSAFRLLVKSHQDKHLRRALAKRVLDQFLLHELDHAANGFLRLSDVRAMARMASDHFVGLMDLQADTVTAQRGAVIESHRFGVYTEYYYHLEFLRELQIMLEYWLPQVRAPQSKPQKQFRFSGLAFMAARLTNFLLFGQPPIPGDLPLDLPLYALTDIQRGELEIIGFTPAMANWLPRTDVELSLLKTFMEGLDNRPAAETIDHARRLLVQAGKLKAPTDAQIRLAPDLRHAELPQDISRPSSSEP